MIEKLLKNGSIRRQGKGLRPTEAGMELASRMPEQLRSASLTAEWENRLLDMEQGKETPERFMGDIQNMITEIVEEVKKIPEPEAKAGLSLGSCPVCGEPVMEGKQYFYCSGRECRFALWKDNKYLDALGKRLSRDMVVDLLRDGVTHVTDFYSRKKHRRFIADLCLVVNDDGTTRYDLSFPNESD